MNLKIIKALIHIQLIVAIWQEDLVVDIEEWFL